MDQEQYLDFEKPIAELESKIEGEIWCSLRSCWYIFECIIVSGKILRWITFGCHLDHGGCVQQFIRCRKLVYIYDRL